MADTKGEDRQEEKEEKGNGAGAMEKRARNTMNPCNSFRSALIGRETLLGSWGGVGRWSRERRGEGEGKGEGEGERER